MEKRLAEGQSKMEEIKNLMESSSKYIVNEKQVKKIINDITRNCDNLMNCLVMENPELLSDDDKKVLINKVNVLESHLDDFRKKMVL